MFAIRVALVLYCASLAHGRIFNSGCRFEIQPKSSSSPSLVDESSSPSLGQYLDTETGKWYYEAEAGSSFKVQCPDRVQHIGLSKDNEFEVKCVVESIVRTPRGLVNFDNLKCSTRALTEEVYRNGTCYNGYTNVEIAFTDADPPFGRDAFCEKSYSWCIKDGESINRPDFKEGAGFYPIIDVDGCYKTASQIETVIELLGSETLVDHYIQPGANLFMSRGHLCPNGDGIEAHEKRATFYFLNAVPQWQTINGGNWNQLEIRSRQVAEERQATLTIYTGTYGVTTLEDVNDNPVEIWLGKDSQGNLLKRLPVPHLTWKVVHDEKAGDAVAVIQINNPWNTIKPEDILCDDVCDQISWVDWKVTDIRLGYTYCCDVESFANAIPYAPKLGSLPLLK